MGNLAMAYRLDQQLAKALPLFEETRAKMNAKLGPDHPMTLHTINDLATAYKAGGQFCQGVAAF